MAFAVPIFSEGFGLDKYRESKLTIYFERHHFTNWLVDPVVSFANELALVRLGGLGLELVK